MDRANVTVIRPSVPSIPGYIIKEKIGEGGMATVYLAIQESLDRTAALKIVAPSMIAIDPQSSERFLKEGRIVAHLNHPNIVTVYDIGKAHSFYYMAMEYISEGTLSDRLKNDKTIHDPLGIIRQIAKALGYAHKSGVIHRDVKPGNILFREDDSVVLSDFGIAKALSSRTNLTATGFTAGTPEYMSPEQARGDSVDKRTDLYSLGVVFYELLARKKAFKGEDPFGTAMSHISAPIPLLPEEFYYYQPIIDRLLAKDPDDRYTSAEQLIKALDRHIAGDADYDPGERARRERSTRLVHPIPAIKKRVVLPSIDFLWVLRWSVLITVLVGIMVGGYHWLSAPKIDPQTRWIINMMLEKAGRQLESSKLVEPVGDNAFKSYRDILELMPDNSHALRGLQIVTDKIEQQAVEKQNQGHYEEGLAIIEKGLFASPDSKNLLSRKEELKRLIEDRKSQEELVRMLAQANLYIEELKYTEPAEGNAYMVYQEILKLDPENSEALNGMRRIAEYYGNIASSKLQEGQYKEGFNLIIKGLQIDPGNQELISLKKTVIGKINETELMNKIAGMHLLAEQQLADAKFIDPANDNAFDTYQKILIVDSHNKKAVEGSAHVIQLVMKNVLKMKSAGNYEGALNLADRAIELQPDNREIQVVKVELQEMLEAQRRHEKVQKMKNLAKKQTMESKLLTPPGDNAYETYQNIKDIDPENKDVRAGLNAIAARIIELAQGDQKRGLLEEGIKKLDQGLEVYPNNSEFTNMRANLARQLEEKRVEQQLTQLIETAKQQIAEEKYTSPLDDNAYETYMKIAVLDPKNPHVDDGLNAIADYYLKSARQAAQGGSLTVAIHALNEGLKARPKNRSMARLKTEILAKLEDQTRRADTVKQMFSKLDEQNIKQQYVEPAGDNVLETYKEILLIDPGNSMAMSGLSELREFFSQNAIQKQQVAEYKDSLALINDGLKVSPEDRGLLSLRDEVTAQLKIQTRNNKIGNLHTKADLQIDASRLTLPKGDNAYETYQKILEIDPDNKMAKSGIDHIAMRYLQLGKERQAQGELHQGLSIIEEGLSVFPNEKKLRALKIEFDKLIIAEQQAVLVAKLLDGAEQQVNLMQLTEPNGDNAYETYNKVLDIEPGNTRAKDGINNIQERYLQSGQEYSTKGEYRKGMELVEEGLEFFPKNNALINLKARFAHALKVDQQMNLLEGLFNQADQQLAGKRLTQPKGDNALHTYQRILEIDPGNSRAENGIANIPKLYIQMGRESQSSGYFDDGLAMIQEGLAHYPDNDELIGLKTELENKIKEGEQSRSLTNLLVKAEKQIAAVRLTMPDGDNAYETYLHVLEIDPGNTKAKQGINTIADRYEALAVARQKKGEFNRSLANIDKGLIVNPNHPGLKKLRIQVSNSMKQMSDKNRKVSSLIRKAENQYRASKLIQPVGNNAHETYLEILSLDRGNKKALEGLSRIAQHYKTIALQKQREGDLTGSLQNVKKGLMVDPGSDSLNNLLASLQDEIEGRNRATKEALNVDKLLAQANRKLGNGQLIQPVGNSALDVYRKILAIEPGNREALNGINRISQELEEKARVKQNNGNLLEGLSIVDDGLRQIPDSANLLSLRAELKRAIAAQQKKEQESKKSTPVFGTF